MKNRQMIVALLAGSLTLATSLRGADPPDPASSSTPPSQPNAGQTSEPGQMQSGQSQPNQGTRQSPAPEMAPEHSCLSATYLIGREVRNDMGEHLGTLHDLIVSLDSGHARFAIVKSGGTLGIGGTRIAVPLKDLQWSGDTKEFIMAATKEQILSASAAPTGGWAFAANQDWAGKVDRFYGNPGHLDLALPGRSTASQSDDTREFVRDAVRPVPEALLPEDQPPTSDIGPKEPPATPADREILVKVNQIIGQYAGPATGSDVRAMVQRGVVTLKGKVATATQKSVLESQIKKLSDVVTLIDDQLVASNE